MHQLKFIYNSPLKDSYSHLIHTCFPMIASNEMINNIFICTYHYYEKQRFDESEGFPHVEAVFTNDLRHRFSTWIRSHSIALLLSTKKCKEIQYEFLIISQPLYFCLIQYNSNKANAETINVFFPRHISKMFLRVNISKTSIVNHL